MGAKVLVINGPNLNLLGSREPDQYGTTGLQEINNIIAKSAAENNLEIEFFQSNHEGALIDAIHEAIAGEIDYLIINPGAFTHYSYAIRDAIKAVNIPAIEVHLSNIHNREEFRKHSVIAPVCLGQVSGFGSLSYLLALQAVIFKESGQG
ncbi:MAG: type II 3-dehydroquinate dehydratase [Clostridia bacterium]|jgi:3-dehydroquinate dehydratase-2|nr:type II 3-dehydroquinate dehydratase [Clostridia bacterium]